MQSESSKKLADAIRDVPDFPKPGIVFKDITPVLADGVLFDLSLGLLQDTVAGERIDKVVGIDARGFIFGAALANRLQCGFVPVRKKGKLPWNTHSVSYALEYGENAVELHVDAVHPGERVWLVDDLLATGGTAEAALQLMNKLGGSIVAASFFVELTFLQGRSRLEKLAPVHSIVRY
jgi:adenine phosphoribosyltransferase